MPVGGRYGSPAAPAAAVAAGSAASPIQDKGQTTCIGPHPKHRSLGVAQMRIESSTVSIRTTESVAN
jgi:hypothetical protein